MTDEYEKWLIERLRKVEENIYLNYGNCDKTNWAAISNLNYQRSLLLLCLEKYNEYKREKGE